MEASNPKSEPKQPDLTRRDWILAALAAFAEGGVEAVRIEPLAKNLGVSKGSFYWHFKDRAALLDGLIELWNLDFTRAMIDRVAPLESAAERLRALARDVLASTMYGVDSAMAEAALQAWARMDPQVAARVRLIEEERVSYLASELALAGLPKRRAGAMARTIYLALLGLYSTRSYNPQLADDACFIELVELVLDQARNG